MFLFSSFLWAQEKVLIGKVSDESGEPLPDASVETIGGEAVSTDIDGNYSIKVNEGDEIVFSFIGLANKTLKVGSASVLNVTLSETEGTEIEQVVVTALGIKKEKKALTYSAQEVKGEELTRVKDTNPINALAGKAAGVNITRSSSGAGGSVKVTLRGLSSVRNNQPLYVIDGIPIVNNSGVQPNNSFGNEFIGGNRDGGDVLSLINPDDIESLTVLRGASASALYGSQGANGVILITTKKGKEGKVSLTLSSNLTFEKAAYLPKLQYEYLSANGAESWGEKGASPDHIDDFYETGITKINSLSLSFGSEKATSYLSFANTDSEGVMPDNELKQNNVAFKQSFKFFDDKLKVDASANLSEQKIKNRPVNGLYFNPIVGTYFFPRGEDFKSYKNNFEVYDPKRKIYTQNYPANSITDIQQNPFWITNRNQSDDTTIRSYISGAVSYDVNDWLTLKTRASYDVVNKTFEKKMYAGTQGALAHENGRYIYEESKDRQTYMDFIALVNKNITDDLEFNATLGTSSTQTKLGDLTYMDSGITEGLKIVNWFNIANFNSTAGIGQKIITQKQVNSVFGSAQFGYKKMVYLDVTGRNDWSSTLDDSFFYPSVGVTGILSEMFDMGSFIKFAKVRASYAEVGNDIPSFVLNNTSAYYERFNSDFTINPTISNKTGDQLKPELQKSWEIGTEWRFLNNRIGLEASYYHTNTTDQFFQVPASSTNPLGVDYFAVNGGDIQNQGVEVMLTTKPIKKNNFSWDTTFNFAYNESMVKEIVDDLGDELVLTTPGVNSYQYSVIEGQPLGSIKGINVVRDENGYVVFNVDDNGNPTSAQKSTDFEVLGTPNPDWTLGWSNTFNYKNFSLNFLVDARVGGKTMSLTQAMLDKHGVSQDSADARNAGGIEAVDQNGNRITVSAEDYYNAIGGRDGASGEYIYDATNIRLSEASLGYNFNVKNSFIQKANVSLIGRNLFFLYKDAPYDPNITSSTGEGFQGVDVFGMPSVRSIGFNMSVTF